jgi:hypothetical protein
MNKTKRCLLTVSVALLAVTAIAWAQPFSARPGEYEMTVEMQFPGAPAPMSQKSLSCLSPDDAQDVYQTLKKALAEQGQCQVSNEKNSPGKLEFDMLCINDGTRSSTKVEMTFIGDDAYEQVTTTTVGSDVITMKTKAKWLRATCSAESLSDDDE